jgi:hypothetical protein
MTPSGAGATPPDGPFETFHTTGEVATRGRYAGGKYDGTLSRFASSTPGTEPLRSCCVPPGARELRAEYSAGRLLSENFYDDAGLPLCADGTRWPERPPGVPESAHFDEGSRRYCEREGGLLAPSRLAYYRADGTREEEFEFADGHATLRRGFGPDGRLVEEWELEGGIGKRHGAYRFVFDAATTPFTAAVHEERGRYERGERAGTIQLLGAGGEPLRTIEHGEPLGESPPLVTGEEPADDSPGALRELAERLLSERRPREAFAVAARALARTADVAHFRALLAREVAELRPEFAAARAEHAAAANERTPSRVLDALLSGAAPAPTLRALATSISPASRGALDYAEAAFLLAPEEGVTRVTRGMIRLEHGERDGALEDAVAVLANSAEAGEFLLEAARILFPEFGFDPREDPVTPSDQELPAFGPAQPLDRLRQAIGLYATRIKLVREELLRRFPANTPWLPPDTSALLPSGPLELRRYVAQIRDEDEPGKVEVSEVLVDETLIVAGRSLRALLTAARSDWAALSWLAWSAGLDQVALPEILVERELFPAAMNRAMLRCFWAHDRVKTNGLAALARKLPPFQWQGRWIQSLPRQFAEIAAAEYLEVRAVFGWLLFAENVSPFQADLRTV